ncbi:Stress protein UspA-like protein [Melioribacter roseus P3M-2]|uniref:Stress protein UspA-like protein n=1 Tax=Melioribacter roseus (strain DSM 23840 / JCM 17771 / VKM B-2668 / P3M-2) TaxID=1191523 RepID=I6YT18_MELRP|nr:universal stress protein [Melioribacter roseus]AFN73692.1 Stress protein UspA-like protein [Melioribacter roseus P3M-2]
MKNVKNIIMPTDFSRLSLSAFELVKQISELINAEIHIIHVAETNPPIISMKSYNIDENDLKSKYMEQTREELEKIADELRDETDSRIKSVLLTGLDFEEIVKYAAELHKPGEAESLIVIATHGRTGLMHTLMGSVAEKVIRYAKCPVLVVPHSSD